jgi:hypothetical protein
MKTILRTQNYLNFDLFFQAFPGPVPMCPVDKWVPFFPHINMDPASVFVAWAPDGSGLVLPIWMPSFHVFAIEDGLERNFFGLRCQPNSSDEPVPEHIEPVFLVTDQNPSLPGQSMYLVLQADVGDYSGALFSVERETAEAIYVRFCGSVVTGTTANQIHAAPYNLVTPEPERISERPGKSQFILLCGKRSDGHLRT